MGPRTGTRNLIDWLTLAHKVGSANHRRIFVLARLYIVWTCCAHTTLIPPARLSAILCYISSIFSFLLVKWQIMRITRPTLCWSRCGYHINSFSARFVLSTRRLFALIIFPSHRLIIMIMSICGLSVYLLLYSLFFMHCSKWRHDNIREQIFGFTALCAVFKDAREIVKW